MRTGTNWVYVAALLAMVPMLVAQCMNLAHRPHFQFFPLAWIAFAATVFLKGKPSLASGFRFQLGIILGVIGIACFAGSIILFSPWLAQCAAIAGVLSWMFVCLAGTPWYQLMAWMILLLVTLPLPQNLDGKLVQWLQQTSTWSASRVLDVLSVPHMASGNVLDVRTGSLFVDQACSGVDSLYALFAIAAALSVWQCRSLVVGVLLLASVPFWAWLGNVVRISLIATLLDKYQFDLSHGVGHTLLGLGLFAVSTYFLMSTLNAITHFTEPFPVRTVSSNAIHALYNQLVCWPNLDPTAEGRKKTRPAIEMAAESIPIGIGRNHLVMASVLLAVGLSSFLPLMGLGPWKDSRVGLPAFGLENVKAKFTRDLMPGNIQGMNCVAFDVTQRPTSSSYGEFSVTWEFQNPNDRVLVSLDFPFPGYHTLEGCYGFAGKRLLTSVEHVDIQGPSIAPLLTVNQALLIDDIEQQSFLSFTLTERSGAPVGPTGTLNRGVLATGSNIVSYQFQVHRDVVNQISEDEKAQCHEVLRIAIERLLPVIQTMSK